MQMRARRLMEGNAHRGVYHPSLEHGLSQLDRHVRPAPTGMFLSWRGLRDHEERRSPAATQEPLVAAGGKDQYLKPTLKKMVRGGF